jgi:2-polyprenyl-6-methoxyphenol hydroxylase-like FAD-dependent oxidoreductase
MTSNERYQVIIVGGGPVGVALAVELGLRGIRCAMVERYVDLPNIPKGQNLTSRTLEHFHFWGIEKELRKARVMPPGYPIGGVTTYGTLSGEYWFMPPGREQVRSFYYTANERLPQYLTEKVLRRRLEDFPIVDAMYGWTAEAFEQDEDGVRVTIAETKGDGRRVLEGEYVVGCDGARSMVRDGLGIAMGGTDFGRRMVLAVFRSKELHEGLKRFPERTTYRVLNRQLDGYWQFFGRIDVGEGWFFHAPVPPDATAENFDLHSFLQQVAGFPFAAEFDYIGFWDLRIGIAEQYRQGRIFIAGDAAHTHPPYGGFGLNSGLEDIVNLGWKLAAVLQGWGGETLLASYEAERRPIMIEITEGVIKGNIEKDRDLLRRFSPERNRKEFEVAWKAAEATSSETPTNEPHYEGSPIVLGPPDGKCSVYSKHSYVAQAGHHLTPQLLSDGRSTFDALGTNFTLFAFDAPEGAVAPFVSAAKDHEVPLTVVLDPFEAGRAAYESRLILVRPDQYIAWTGDVAPPDAEAVVRRVAGS